MPFNYQEYDEEEAEEAYENYLRELTEWEDESDRFYEEQIYQQAIQFDPQAGQGEEVQLEKADG